VEICDYFHALRGTKNWIRVGGILRGLLHIGRHGDTGRSEDCATGALDLAPQQEPLAVLLHFHHLEAIQVLDHVRPLKFMIVLGQPSLQFLPQHRKRPSNHALTWGDRPRSQARHVRRAIRRRLTPGSL